MARQSANQLKVKKQSSAYISQAHYRSMEVINPLYSVKEISGKVIATNLTFLQATKQFSGQLTNIQLVPEG